MENENCELLLNFCPIFSLAFFPLSIHFRWEKHTLFNIKCTFLDYLILNTFVFSFIHIVNMENVIFSHWAGFQFSTRMETVSHLHSSKWINYLLLKEETEKSLSCFAECLQHPGSSCRCRIIDVIYSNWNRAIDGRNSTSQTCMLSCSCFSILFLAKIQQDRKPLIILSPLIFRRKRRKREKNI